MSSLTHIRRATFHCETAYANAQLDGEKWKKLVKDSLEIAQREIKKALRELEQEE